VRVAVEQVRQPKVVDVPRVAQRPPVLRRRLTVGPGRGRALGRCAGMLEDCIPVPGRLRVMGQPGRVRRPVRRRGQRREQGTVQLAPPAGWSRRFDREPRELVAECDLGPVPAHHPGGQTLVERPELVGRRNGVQEPELRRRRHDRDGLEEPARAR